MSAMRFLSDKDLEWMASYEQGDTILFQSSNGIGGLFYLYGE